TGAVPSRRGNRHPSIVPYETFRAADGYVNIAVGNDGQWRALCRAVGAPRDQPGARGQPRRADRDPGSVGRVAPRRRVVRAVRRRGHPVGADPDGGRGARAPAGGGAQHGGARRASDGGADSRDRRAGALVGDAGLGAPRAAAARRAHAGRAARLAGNGGGDVRGAGARGRGQRDFLTFLTGFFAGGCFLAAAFALAFTFTFAAALRTAGLAAGFFAAGRAAPLAFAFGGAAGFFDAGRAAPLVGGATTAGFCPLPALPTFRFGSASGRSIDTGSVSPLRLCTRTRFSSLPFSLKVTSILSSPMFSVTYPTPNFGWATISISLKYS